MAKDFGQLCASYGDLKVGFSETLSREVSRYCINVNCVASAGTHTPAFERGAKSLGISVEDFLKRAQSIHPLARGFEECRGKIRIAKPRDVANMVVFLCSDRTEWVTGESVSVSGGF